MKFHNFLKGPIIKVPLIPGNQKATYLLSIFLMSDMVLSLIFWIKVGGFLAFFTFLTLSPSVFAGWLVSSIGILLLGLAEYVLHQKILRFLAPFVAEMNRESDDDATVFNALPRVYFLVWKDLKDAKRRRPQ